jgi:Cdc6-like AAA superfamily ATPase
MINIDLIELQKGCKATCAVIQNKDIEKLDSKILVGSNCEDNELIKIFKEKISKADEKFEFLVIEEIDNLEVDKQDKFYQIVKDREFNGIALPEDVVIVLTVENRDKLKNIASELHNLCVVAF